jgi:hypothetical protein
MCNKTGFGISSKENGSTDNLFNIPLIFFIIFNSIESGTDMLGLILILLQVPKNAKIMNNGIHKCFRADSKNQSSFFESRITNN